MIIDPLYSTRNIRNDLANSILNAGTRRLAMPIYEHEFIFFPWNVYVILEKKKKKKKLIFSKGQIDTGFVLL
jgi:hypothetical protein